MRTERTLAVTTDAAPQDRRTQHRNLCSNLAEIAFADQQGRQVRQQALVEDVSQEGVCVSSSLPLTEGWKVTLHADGFTAEANVRYCQLGDYSFLIGLQFEPETSPGRFGWRPDHLLES